MNTIIPEQFRRLMQQQNFFSLHSTVSSLEPLHPWYPDLQIMAICSLNLESSALFLALLHAITHMDELV